MKYCGTEDAANIYVELILPRGTMKNEMISWRTLIPKNPVVLLMEKILLIQRNLMLKMTPNTVRHILLGVLSLGRCSECEDIFFRTLGKLLRGLDSFPSMC